MQPCPLTLLARAISHEAIVLIGQRKEREGRGRDVTFREARDFYRASNMATKLMSFSASRALFF